ncbi:C-Jun-amino-terminal kinase-interacting protein 4 [Denticeps clupeoides]|uniref:C-Jun-amino-terminal kinase-interacting protein 4-like n=1 Tax=Denticeps clupeoides TaxID=299321 RepID=A0AAY4AD65_9TELE|nr:C-Jun-amino-terminal kinase-interacting protein 4-like [Denticeps clupeoides]
MEGGEGTLCASGDLELDADIVSEEAGKLYSELQVVIETHGTSVVESLLPVLVWVLEGLASCRAKLREREDEVEKERAERVELMERFQNERVLRRESQEKYLELDDQVEQERRAMRAREKEKEKRERELEKKAREQADQLLALEEQKMSLSRELSSLKHTHSKLVLASRDLIERRKDSEREGSPLRNHVLSKKLEFQPTPDQSETCIYEQQKSDMPSNLSLLESPAVNEEVTENPPRAQSFISDIINSTPELQDLVEASTPLHSTAEESREEERSHLDEEIRNQQTRDGEVEKNEKNVQEEDVEKKEEEEEDEEELESLEWELRNTDSVFSELSELSRDYVESVDHGASLRDGSDQFEEILSQYEELKNTHQMVDAARKALISRVEELTNERFALNLEVTSFKETITRMEGRMKEMEEETKRLRKEVESVQSEDPEAVPLSLRRFSRSEMARVVMEKNQYKERLFELQEALRRSQTLRVTKDERSTEERKGTVWRRFNRLFGLTKDPFAPPQSLAIAVPSLPTTSASTLSPAVSPQKLSVNQTQTDVSLSPRLRRREMYREIRSHVWGTLGKRQIHGWSMPLSHTQESPVPSPEPKDVPVLVQMRLLDQRDATAKLTCAVAVTPEMTGEQMCSVWTISGPASSSDITVIDPTRSNTILDQFSLPPTSPALCVCAVPPAGETSGTVWIGTQDGGVLVHSASKSRRRCLQSVTLSEGVHSLTYAQGQVIAGLANGTLAFFSHRSIGWDLQSKEELSLGSALVQPIRCCLAKGESLWVGYWNRIHMIDVQSRKVEKSFAVSERSEQQVRFLCVAGTGVWAACRLDTSLRLFDWATGRPLQEVDVSPMVTKALGSAFLSLAPLQISALAVVCGRLWVGTGSGAIFSIPLTLSSETSSIPYCTLALAQLCYHGHRQAVKFIIAAPGCHNSSTAAECAGSNSQLILSGGEGYVNFRIGDDANDGINENVPLRSERSHMIIWQTSTTPIPSPAL